MVFSMWRHGKGVDSGFDERYGEVQAIGCRLWTRVEVLPCCFVSLGL
jgi:hypothetical protein